MLGAMAATTRAKPPSGSCCNAGQAKGRTGGTTIRYPGALRSTRARASDDGLRAPTCQTAARYGITNLRVARMGQIEVKLAPPTRRKAAEMP